MTKILFITATRLGDAVLSTGLLNYLYQTYPEAKVTVACGPLPQSIFEGFPNVEQIIPLKKEKFHGHWRKLWSQVFGTNWDIVIDLRNSAVSRLIFAKQRHIFTSSAAIRTPEELEELRKRESGMEYSQDRHKVEQAAAVMGLKENTPAPKLYFTDAQLKKAEELIPKGDFVLGVGPTANWIGKTWPAERFVDVIKQVTAENGVLPNARIAVFAAPGEEENANIVMESIPEARRLDVIAKGNPGEAAAALSRCGLYIGNDSGLMHCAAAAGVPTIGLFGPSWPHLYKPWGEHTTFIGAPEDFATLTDFEGYDPKTLDHTLMGSLTVKHVTECVQEFWEEQIKNAA